MPPGKPDDDTLGRVNGLVKNLLEADAENPLESIEFKAHLFGGEKDGKWRASFLGELAMFVVEQSKEVVFAERDDVWVVDLGRVAFSTNRKARIRIGDRSFGMISSLEMLARYRAWKGTA